MNSHETGQLGVLTSFGLSWSLVGDDGVDVTGGGVAARYRVVERSHVSTSSASALVAMLGDDGAGRRPLVLASTLAPGAADVLRDADVAFLDGAGNAYLAAPGLLVDVRGRRSAGSENPRPTASRAFTRSGAQVTFVLLAWPEIVSRPVRDVATVAGVSVGAAQLAIAALSDAGYVVPGRDRRHLVRGGELLDRWVEAYALRLAPKLGLGRFGVDDLDRLAHDRGLTGLGVQLGGEAAAAALDPHLRAQTVTLYAEAVSSSLVARYRMRPDPDGDVEVRRRFWTQPQMPGGTGDLEALAPSVLVYADALTSTDPRTREHARRVRSADDRLTALDRS